MRQRFLLGRWRSLTSLFLFGLAFALGLLAILESEGNPPEFTPEHRSSPIADLLQWLPATDATVRGYAAWVALPESPLSVTDAIDRLGLVPQPIALGRSSEFQRATGISASRVTGWASAYGAGVGVLAGQFDPDAIAAGLADSGYEDSSFRGVTIWTSPSPRAETRTVQGDDVRAANVVAPFGDRVLIAYQRSAMEASLDAASGRAESLADRPELQEWIADAQVAGIMTVDLRDLAVECGVAGQWRKNDFDAPSGRSVGIAYYLDAQNGAPVTSIWIDLVDEVVAEASLFTFEDGWKNGFINQIGLGSPISALATVSDVRRSGTHVVADLVRGRDNGWVRSGVRYLVEICEHSSTLVPAGQPIRATPLASPSPEESP